MFELLGGLTMMVGGGAMTSAAALLHQAHARTRQAREFGAGLTEALAETVAEPLPADMQALLDRLA